MAAHQSHHPTDGSGLDIAGISQLLDPNSDTLLQQTGVRPTETGHGKVSNITLVMGRLYNMP